MIEIKIALDVIHTCTMGCVDGILVGNMNLCELVASYGVSLGSYQVYLGSRMWKGWFIGNIK